MINLLKIAPEKHTAAKIEPTNPQNRLSYSDQTKIYRCNRQKNRNPARERDFASLPQGRERAVRVSAKGERGAVVVEWNGREPQKGSDFYSGRGC
jgi:hypothetical protein